MNFKFNLSFILLARSEKMTSESIPAIFWLWLWVNVLYSKINSFFFCWLCSYSTRSQKKKRILECFIHRKRTDKFAHAKEDANFYMNMNDEMFFFFLLHFCVLIQEHNVNFNLCKIIMNFLPHFLFFFFLLIHQLTAESEVW